MRVDIVLSDLSFIALDALFNFFTFIATKDYLIYIKDIQDNRAVHKLGLIDAQR